MGRGVATVWGTCIDWPITVDQQPIGAPTAPPLLIVAGLHDPATPYVGVAEMQVALGNGSHLVTYEGDGHAQLILSACVRSQEDAFLDDPTQAPAVTTCPAQ